jgi:signal transduction histidine kinase
MTRRILAGFIGVLVFLLGLVVGPLGVKISAQQRDDFRHSAQSAARALANAEEERLGDTGDATDRGSAAPLSVDAGDGVVVLGPNGNVIATAGRMVSPAVLDAVRGNGKPSAPDAVVVTAPIGSTARPDGIAILVRDAEPLDQRVRALWLALVIAALVTIGLGAVVAFGLAKWIGRPLRDLGTAATRMGQGALAVRTDAQRGPPEVRAVAASFNDMAGRLGDLLDSQRNMTADVSHQLRTPLAALQLRLELLAEDSPEPARSELADALREIARLNRLLDGLLAVARAEETASEPSVVDVADVVTERVEMWSSLAQERHVGLSVSTEPAAAMVTPGNLEQVLDNLIANAMDALSPGDDVNVSLRSIDDAVVLTVSDNGPGMSAARRTSAFDRFETDQSGRKSGLGLAIVGRLVATDHGSIALAETEGGGLTAMVRLRAAPQPAAAGAAP